MPMVSRQRRSWCVFVSTRRRLRSSHSDANTWKLGGSPGAAAGWSWSGGDHSPRAIIRAMCSRSASTRSSVQPLPGPTERDEHALAVKGHAKRVACAAARALPDDGADRGPGHDGQPTFAREGRHRTPRLAATDRPRIPRAADESSSRRWSSCRRADITASRLHRIPNEPGGAASGRPAVRTGAIPVARTRPVEGGRGVLGHRTRTGCEQRCR